MTLKSHRHTIFVDEAEILIHEGFPGRQWVLRVRAKEIAAHAKPGQFAHIRCSAERDMRRPLSIMRVDARAGWVDFLYKVVGDGTRLLSQRQVGEHLSIMGPIGKAFELHNDRPRPLLIGGGVGMPPMVFIAEHCRDQKHLHPFVILGSEVPFPFQSRPSQFIVPGQPDGVIAAAPLLEDWGIASRLASTQGYPGCYDGYVTGLARSWLDALDDVQRRQVEIFSCGPHPMLEAVAALAHEYDLPCQVSLEEFMACAVGGCAGCTVEVNDNGVRAMKRVCVDGPVFDARSVYLN